MRDVRVAAAKINSAVGDFEGNLARHREFVTAAARDGAEILCFPELSLCGYPLEGDLPHELARPLDDELVLSVSGLAGEFGIVVMAGMLERDRSGLIYNSQLIASPGGGIARHRKAHVPTSEIGRFRPGNELPVFALPQAVVGLQVCYDTHFPEATIVQALAGAEIVFMPHASTGTESAEQKRARWLRYLPARAYDAGVFALVVNQLDPARGFPGVTMAFDPWGAVLAESIGGDEDLLVVDFRADALIERRRVAETYFMHFRRPELYRPVST